MSKELSEALGGVLALVEKATPGDFAVKFSTNVMAGDGLAATNVSSNIPGHDPDRNEKNADAIVAAINFLRQHGPAIAAALRAVEGAATGRVDMLCARDAVVVDEIAEDRMLALHKQRVALVPLDAAGSAEGV